MLVKLGWGVVELWDSPGFSTQDIESMLFLFLFRGILSPLLAEKTAQALLGLSVGQVPL